MGKATRAANRAARIAQYREVIVSAMACARHYPLGHPLRAQWAKTARALHRQLQARRAIKAA